MRVTLIQRMHTPAHIALGIIRANVQHSHDKYENGPAVSYEMFNRNTIQTTTNVLQYPHTR